MKRTKKESHARNKSTLGLVTLEVMHQMCDNLGYALKGCVELVIYALKTQRQPEEVPMGLTVRQLELIASCEFLCEHKEQLNQIRQELQ